MAVPKKKTSKSRRDQRRAHDFLKAVSHTECQNCGEIIRPHHLCSACGHYGSKHVIEQRPTEENSEEVTKE
jgi:large subunit ribosomal protein L32